MNSSTAIVSMRKTCARAARNSLMKLLLKGNATIPDPMTTTNLEQAPNQAGFGSLVSFGRPTEQPSPFPMECLPGIAGVMAAEISRCSTCQNDALSAASILGTISAAIGASAILESGHGRNVRGNLFILPVAASGTGKSETFQRATKPLRDAELRRLDDWERNVAPSILARQRVLEREQRRLLRTSEGADLLRMETIEKDIASTYRELAARPCFLVGDATKEKLAEIMAGQPREVLASMSPEARGILQIIDGKYSGGDDFDFYCSGYSGDLISIDRVKNQNRILLRQPCLAITWMVQPDVLATLLQRRAITDGGLLPRFLLFDTLAEPRERGEEEEAFSPVIESNWTDHIEGILALRTSADVIRVELSEEARRVLLDFDNQTIRARRGNSLLVRWNHYIARWHENACKLALVLHAATYGSNLQGVVLSEETAHAAVSLMKWFLANQIGLLRSSFRDSAVHQAERLKRLLIAKGNRATMRDLGRGGFSELIVGELLSAYPESFRQQSIQNPNGGPRSTVISLHVE